MVKRLVLAFTLMVSLLLPVFAEDEDVPQEDEKPERAYVLDEAGILRAVATQERERVVVKDAETREIISEIVEGVGDRLVSYDGNKKFQHQAEQVGDRWHVKGGNRELKYVVETDSTGRTYVYTPDRKMLYEIRNKEQ